MTRNETISCICFKVLCQYLPGLSKESHEILKIAGFLAHIRTRDHPIKKLEYVPLLLNFRFFEDYCIVKCYVPEDMKVIKHFQNLKVFLLIWH
jgi:hypothetical protein